MLGLGPLEPLLEDDSIADIMVNGPNRIFIERGGKRDAVRRRGSATRRIWPASASASPPPSAAASTNRSPMVDARLKDGSRVNIVFPPLALDGPYVSIRKFRKKAHRLRQAGRVRRA